jgi:hypothetical protein
VRHARLVMGFAVLPVMARYPLGAAVERGGSMVKAATAQNGGNRGRRCASAELRGRVSGHRWEGAGRCAGRALRAGVWGEQSPKNRMLVEMGRALRVARAWVARSRWPGSGRGREHGGGCGHAVVGVADAAS